MEKSALHRTEYKTLIDLARSRNIKAVEAKGLDTRSGVRFQKDGYEWIAVDSDLSIEGKTRALGFLLENEPSKIAVKAGFRENPAAGEDFSYVLTLCC